jgi:hypothetical protein
MIISCHRCAVKRQTAREQEKSSHGDVIAELGKSWYEVNSCKLNGCNTYVPTEKREFGGFRLHLNEARPPTLTHDLRE